MSRLSPQQRRLVASSGTEGFLEEVDGLRVALLGDEQVGPFAEDLGEAGSRADLAKQLDGLVVGRLRFGVVAGLMLGPGQGEQGAGFGVGVLGGSCESKSFRDALSDRGLGAGGQR